MVRIVAGKIVELPETSPGKVPVEEIRRVAGTQGDRILTVERADGSTELVPPRGEVELRPQDQVVDRINATRG